MWGPLLAPSPNIPNWVQFTSLGINILSAIIGLAIAYLAYRGYRRNDSRPMLFIAIGFVLALGIPFTLLVVSLLLASVPAASIPLTVGRDVSTLAGLVCILYALWMPTER